ncbi:MAG TPA: hypothetical protein VJR89_19645, partial [Polyangiales bacterium]|nr:hypothetical protein [Polyangiales bacterium]
ALGCSVIYGAWAAPVWWKQMDEHFRSTAASLPRGKELEDSVIILLNTRDYIATPFVALYRRLFETPGPVFMHVAGVSKHAVQVTRPDDDSLILAPEHGYLDESSSLLVRSRREPFTRGQQILLISAKVRVEDVTPDGRPARVRIETFGLSNPKYLWMVWDDRTEGYVRFPLPERGQTVVLPAAPH